MVRIEIDISKEIEEIIKEEVEKRLDKIGLLGFARDFIKTEFANSGSKKQLNRHEQQIFMMGKKLNKCVKSEKAEC